MKPKKKIAIVCNSKGYTGAFKAIFDLSKTIEEKADIVFIIPNNSKIKQILIERNLTFYEIGFKEISLSPSLVIYPILLFINSIKILKIIRMKKIDILHINDIYNMVGIICKILDRNIYLVYHVRLLKDSYIQKLYNVFRWLLIKYSDKIICVSRAVHNSFKDSPKSILIYDRIKLKEKLPPYYINKSSRPIQLLYLANYTNGKGHELAIEVAKELASSGIKFKLQFYGHDFGILKNIKFKNTLKRKTIDFEIQDYIAFHNQAVDIEKVYKNHDLFLNFSKSESFSLTCYEAAFFGVPIITFKDGGVIDYLNDENSMLISIDSGIYNITKSIIELIDDPELRVKYSINAKNTISQFSNVNNKTVIESVFSL